MSNGFPVNLPSGFIFDVNNLVWSIDVSHIFVDYRYNDELFINSCSVIENVFQFHVLSPLKCNPNLFGHFFHPYIYLNLDEYDIPSSSCFSIDFFMHPSIINVVYFTSDFVLCPTFINVFSFDSIFCFTYVLVFCAFAYVLYPISMNVCFASDFIYLSYLCLYLVHMIIN